MRAARLTRRQASGNTFSAGQAPVPAAIVRPAPRSAPWRSRRRPANALLEPARSLAVGQPSSAYRGRHLFIVPTSTRSRAVLALVGGKFPPAAGYVGLLR